LYLSIFVPARGIQQSAALQCNYRINGKIACVQ
jgi:hypothetical protein